MLLDEELIGEDGELVLADLFLILLRRIPSSFLRSSPLIARGQKREEAAIKQERRTRMRRAGQGRIVLMIGASEARN